MVRSIRANEIFTTNAPVISIQPIQTGQAVISISVDGVEFSACDTQINGCMVIRDVPRNLFMKLDKDFYLLDY